MRSIIGLSCLSVCIFVSTVGAAERQAIPYEAVVEGESAYVRSGPGKEFFATAKLERGQTVKVIRHDPGGWFVIEPPAGSFSWVDASTVQATGPNIVEALDRTTVFVGSDYGTELSVVQRFIQPGEPIQVIGEGIIQTNRGQVKMLKVKPPKRENRWIAGHSVVPVPGQSLASTPGTPHGFEPRRKQLFQNQPPRNSTVRAPQPQEQPDWNDPNLKVAQGRYNRSQQSHNSAAARNGREVLAQLDRDRQQLNQLDAQFKQIALTDRSQWKFDGIESGYKQLQAGTQSRALQTQIRMRFAALDRYKNAKAAYDDLIQLTNETDRRDAELLSMQKRGAAGRPRDTAKMASTQANAGQIQQTSGQVMAKAYYDAGAQLPLRQAAPAQQPVAQRSPNASGLIGAGIVERSIVPGTPKFVLLNPAGRILAYLNSNTVDLNAMVGRSYGLTGNRQYREDLKTDFIDIRTAVAKKVH